MNVKDNNTLMQLIPIFNTIMTDGTKHYSVFDNTLVLSLFKYFLLNVLYEYTILSTEYSQKPTIKSVSNNRPGSMTTDSVELDAAGTLNEIDIIAGQQIELNEKTAKLLLTYLAV